MMNHISRRKLLGQSAAAAAIVAAVTVPAATVTQAAEPGARLLAATVMLCPHALRAALRPDAGARKRINIAEQAFRDSLTQGQRDQYIAISDAENAYYLNEFSTLVSEVVRHCPALGPAMSLVMAHALETGPGERFECCTGEWILEDIGI